MDYYDQISVGYNELHEEEQLKKLAIIKQHLHPKQNDKLLDVGCGTGISSDWPCQVIGIDPSKELLKQNPRKHIKAKAENIPFENNTFDYIISLTSIQNFQDVEKALEEIKRVSKSSAKLALTFLKKSPKAETIEEQIAKTFQITKRIEEDKDIIMII